MTFPAVPTVSKNKIRAAGKILASDSEFIGGAEHARQLLAEWRACHLLPLNQIGLDLQQRLANLEVSAIVALRLKRIFRIVNKLKQFTNMNSTTMQDIAGLRAIAPTVSDVYRIVQDYQSLPQNLVSRFDLIDYVANPKDDGYRSVHLAFRYEGPETSPYDGLRVELQVRTDLQHLWASAVEITGMWKGQRIKYDEGDPAWSELFCLVAEMIARSEGAPACNAYEGMSEEDVRAKLRASEKEIGALSAMRSHAAAELGSEFNPQFEEDQMGKCLLLQVDASRHRLSIATYDIQSQSDAVLAYADAEQQVTFTDGSIAPVLVSVNSPARLRDAYRSFFLDITPFADLVEALLD